MASYYCSVSAVMPASGQSAAAHVDYITRTGKYRRHGQDEIAASGQGGLPGWARSPRDFFAAADLLETAGKVRGRKAAKAKAEAEAEGREYVPAEGKAVSAYRAVIALPAELTDSEREELAKDIMQCLTTTADGRTLHHAWALHRPQPGSQNFHMHVILGTRAAAQDSHPFPASFFAPPKRDGGGARKVPGLGSRRWLASVREMVAERQNYALQAADHAARVDYRTLKAQGINRPAKQLVPRIQWQADRDAERASTVRMALAQAEEIL